MPESERYNATFYLFAIANPSWHSVTDEQKDAVAIAIETGGWTTVDGKRRGFLHCVRAGNVVYGYYAQEGSIRVEQYDESQNPIVEEQDSFERILFLLYLESGILLVQSIRVPKYIDLTGTILRVSLFTSLETVFRKSNVYFRGKARFERYRLVRTREEMLEIFTTNHISHINIRDLKGRYVPDDVSLFNPDFDADFFLKNVIRDDLETSDEIDWKGDDIQQTKIVKGMAYAGNPNYMEGYNESGELTEWRQSSPQEVQIDVNTTDVYFPEQDLKRLLDLVRRKFDGFSIRIDDVRGRQDTGDLPLFD